MRTTIDTCAFNLPLLPPLPSQPYKKDFLHFLVDGQHLSLSAKILCVSLLTISSLLNSARPLENQAQAGAADTGKGKAKAQRF